MKVFISWSGDKSFEVAKVLKEWIPCVIQGIDPYFSSDDIDKGSRWSTDIAKELEEAVFGILCVTKENLESQWLNFEAGALSKAMDKAKVCPFLFDLKPSDIINSPILQFQMTNIDRDDIYKLFQSMNKCLDDKKLEDAMLEKMFTAFWPQIDGAFKKIEQIPDDNKKQSKKGNQDSILEEMLELLRVQQIILRNPERILPEQYLINIMNGRGNFTDEIYKRLPKGLIMDYLNVREEVRYFIDKYPVEDDEIKNLFALVSKFIDFDSEIMNRIGLNVDMNNELRVRRGRSIFDKN